MLRTLTNDAAAETEEVMVGVMTATELWELGGLGSPGSEQSLLPKDEGTSMGGQEAREDR